MARHGSLSAKARPMVQVSSPPNPLLGGSLVAIAEQLLIRRRLPIDVQLEVTRARFPLAQRVASMLEHVLGVGSVTICLKSDTPAGQASGRFESPLGLSSLGTPAGIRKCLRFEPAILESGLQKIPRGLESADVITVHANAHPEAIWHESRLNPREAVALLSRIVSLWPNGIVIVVGEDSRHTDRNSLPDNCFRSYDLGLNLSEELAVVQASAAFVGMSSGPSVAALLSDVPYLIIKHARHHSELIDLLFQRGNQARFASANQRFLIVDSPFSSGIAEVSREISLLLSSVEFAHD